MRKPKPVRLIKAARARCRQWRALLKNDDLMTDMRRLQKEYRLPVTHGQWIDETDDINNRKLDKNKRGENARDRMQLFRAIGALRAKHKIDEACTRDLSDHIIFTVPTPAPHPKDAILPVVSLDLKKNTYSAVIGPSVDMDDKKVIDNIKHIQKKQREI